jgi:hypothetical protein
MSEDDLMADVQVQLTEFSELISGYTQGFEGRGWLVKQVSDLLDEPDCRFIVLTGGAGVGKSAFMAQLAATHPQWPRYFIRRDSRELLRPGDAKTFLLTVGGQLATLYPDLFKPERLEVVVRQRIGDLQASGDAIGVRIRELEASPFYGVAIRSEQEIQRMAGKATGVEIGRLVAEPRQRTMQDLQCLGLLDPAWLLYQTDPEARIVVLVDALDELRYSPAEEDLLRALCEIPVGLASTEGPKAASPGRKLPEMPPNLRFVVTSRREKFLDRLLGRSDVRELPLAVQGEENRADLRTYTEANLPNGRLDPALAAENRTREGFVRDLLNAADGNFLYLRSVMAAIEAGLEVEEKAYQVRHLVGEDRLPDNLEDLYAHFLASIVGWVKRGGFGDAPWRHYLRPLLGTLAVAREPLSEEQLKAFTGLESEDLGDLLRELRQFVEPVDGKRAYRIYHTSFAEYLLDAESNADYRIDGRKWHGRIADYYVKAWGGLESSLPGLQDAAVRDVHGRYGLRQLAAHLDGANRAKELHKLITQEWMAARFKGSDYTYDGFINDVMLAWRAAHSEAQRQIEADQAPAALAECVRCALIRTSVNSLAANYDPALVARAVETGLRQWPAERALSVARRALHPRYRVDMFAALLATGQLDAEQSTRAQEAGLTAALAIENWAYRARALARLAPHLSGQALARGLAAALAIEEEYAMPWAMSLGGREPGPWDRVDLFTALLATGRLSPEQSTQAQEAGLAAALAIEEACRAQALAKLVPHLSGEALTRGLATALDLEGYDQVSALATPAPQLSGEALEQGLAAALDIKDEYDRAAALAALAQHLSGEALTRGLAAALDIKREGYRAWALAALAKQLSGEALERGLAAALDIKDEYDRAEALAALAPQLSDEALARGLAAALDIKDEYDGAKALAALAPQLSGEARDRAVERGLAAALDIKDETYRAWALAALAPQLSGEALEQGLAAALAIEHKLNRARALAGLAPSLSGEARDRAVEPGLAAALDSEYEVHRTEALMGLAPQLSGEALEQGLAAALDMEEGYRVHALEALAPQLTGEALARGLAAARTIQDKGYRARALAALAPQLRGKARAQAVKQGVAAALAITDENGAQAEALVALASQLNGELLERGLAAALDLEEEYQARALVALAPRLAGEILQQGLAAAKGVKDPYDRAAALAALAPQLAGEARTDALERALAAATGIKDEWARGEALAVLASQLSCEALKQGLAAVLDIESEQVRAATLLAFLPVAPDRAAVLRCARQAITVHLLKNLSSDRRERVLKLCAKGDLLAPPLLDQDTLTAIAGYIVEVCQEWQWM